MALSICLEKEGIGIKGAFCSDMLDSGLGYMARNLEDVQMVTAIIDP